MPVRDLDPATLAALRDVVGESGVLTDPGLVAGYVTDWTGAFTGAAAAVVRPADTAAVAAVVARCAASGVAIVPQGGNTGLVGGSVPPPASAAPGSPAGTGAPPDRPVVVLSLRGLDAIGPVDVVGRCIAVGAGATLANVQRAAAASGFEFGVDLAARDSATIGGMIATNAGGIRVVRRGAMRAQLLGVEAVLADGGVVSRMRPLRKDNVGYDLPGLLAGSEGTLGIVTRALLRLVVPPPATVVCLAAAGSVATAQDLLHRLEAAGATLEAAELMTGPGVGLVCAAPGVRRPLGDAPFYLLTEVSGVSDDVVAGILAGTPGVLDGVLDAGPARALWEVRERHTETIARSSATPVIKLDVAVPLPAVADLVAAVDRLAAPHGGRPILFGHLGDGNLHVNLLDVPVAAAPGLTDDVLRAVDALGGSISAEHGVGRAKTAWLGLGRGPADRRAMTAIKSALDPAGLLNPGVLFG